MCCKPTTFWRTLAVALPVLVLAASLPAGAQQSATETSASNDEENGQPPEGDQSEKPAAEEQYPAKPMGAIRRPEPLDLIEEESKSARPPSSAATRADGAVVCEAGCDGPRGTVVYRKRPTG
jgi:hypothetical protein